VSAALNFWDGDTPSLPNLFRRMLPIPTPAGFLETSKIGLFRAIWIAKLLKTLE
jgi:hypothetical protein